MGGVTSLVGTYDGTKEAAVMVDGLNDLPFGPLFEGPDAYEQIESFQAWLRRMPYMRLVDEGKLALEGRDLYDPTTGDGIDPREWPESGLAKVVAYWKATFLDEDGFLIDSPSDPV